MQKTWSALTSKVQDLIISNVKADLASQIAARVKIVEIEPTDAPDVEDAAKYEYESRKELEHSYKRLDVPQRKQQRAIGFLWDSSIELADPLSAEVVFNLVDNHMFDSEDGRSELGMDEEL